jgi:hypothetical protein
LIQRLPATLALEGEKTMLTTILKKIMSPLLALTLAFGAVATSYEPAEAGHRGRNIGVGVAAGIIGLGILGAAANAGRHRSHHDHGQVDYDDEGPECYKGPKECGWTNRRCFENSWGETVCRGGRWTCWRDTICE